jgi:hypothetical protein
MYRKIAFVIAATTICVPVGAAVAGSPAFAATRTHAAVSVAKQHTESLDASNDTAKEGSSNDTSKDTSTEGSSNDTSKDTSNVDTSPSLDISPSLDLSVG